MRKFLITVNGGSYEVVVEEIGGVAPVAAPSAVPVAPAAPAPVVQAAPAPVVQAAPPAAQQPIQGGHQVKAPMSGSIVSTNVQTGQQVKAGDVLLILEAMKMENEIQSPVAGTVLQVATQKGSSVSTGDVLVVIG